MSHQWYSCDSRAYKYRIYPTKKQARALEHNFDMCRELYNSALRERNEAYKLAGKSISYKSQANQLKEIKQIRSDLNGIHSQVLQDCLRRLDKAFEAFFDRCKKGENPGHPRYKSK
ncbi:MAG: transposase, partial [Acidobacteriota bacterium]